MSYEPIRMGDQFEAPEGFGSIPKVVTVYFLVNAPSEGVARLVHFEDMEAKLMGTANPKKQKPPPAVVLHLMTSQKFECALDSKKLVVVKSPLKLPPWRAALGDRDVIASTRNLKKQSEGKSVTHENRVEKKLKHMAPILQSLRGFLVSSDPIARANEVARLAVPPQNQARFRADLFLFLAFNRNRNAISYRI
jgi:hypothetical protein